MRKILVANPKGGCGKSTIAVHLASWFAMNDEVVYLGDLDRQQSSRLWLEMRSAEQVAIRHWDPTEDLVAPPRDCSVAIYDTPAGLHGKRLKQLLGEVERVIVPVSPSRFDMLASRDFFDELAEAKAIRKERVGVGIIGMRVDARQLDPRTGRVSGAVRAATAYLPAQYPALCAGTRIGRDAVREPRSGRGDRPPAVAAAARMAGDAAQRLTATLRPANG